MDDIVSKVVKNTFNCLPSSIEAIVGNGKNNQVFKVVTEKCPLILRLNNSKEQLKRYEGTRKKSGVLKLLSKLA